MSLWAFRFLLCYICILFIQPQNRFTFLYPFHIADIAVGLSVTLHVFSCMQEKRPIIRWGPATIAACILVVAGYTSLFAGAYQTSSAWNTHLELLVKGAVMLIMVEAMTDTVQRSWAVLATMMIATTWWIKGGLRLSAAGATYYGDRIMGPAVSMIENPNGFAYMMCVMIPLYLYFYQQAEQKYMRWAFLGLAGAAVYIVLETGSRTGMMILITLACFLVPKYGRERKLFLFVGAVVVFFVFSIAAPGNIQRLKTIPKSIKAAFAGEAEAGFLDRDEQSAQERTLKNKDTWALIMEHPLFGVGLTPDHSFFRDRHPYATGQVHCEILMAGKQMGFVGMGLYVAFVGTIILRGRKVQKTMASSWPQVADMGWTLKMQGVAIVMGGAFSPLPWNVVTLMLSGLTSALWLNLQALEAAETAHVQESAQQQSFAEAHTVRA